MCDPLQPIMTLEEAIAALEADLDAYDDDDSAEAQEEEEEYEV